jgi:hypothetical protein
MYKMRRDAGVYGWKFVLGWCAWMGEVVDCTKLGGTGLGDNPDRRLDQRAGSGDDCEATLG